MYSIAELTDIVLVFGFCEGNGRKCVRVYRERFPNRRVPNHQTFAAVERRLRETGRLKYVAVDCGRRRSVRTVEVEEEILEQVAQDPSTSTRRLSSQIGVSKNVVQKVLKEQMLYPYHIQRVQELLPPDRDMRLQFCQFIMQKRTENLNFVRTILFTDEACFTRKGITNLKNEHVYAEENPRAIKPIHFQREFKINVWAGIVNDIIVGPAILPPNLNGENYLQHLRELPDLLDDVPILLRRDMWFMHDGAPAHFSVPVRNFLNENYEDKWIGRGNDAPVHWPPRSPDITPMDFFLWGTVKSLVYAKPVNTRDELWTRIQNAFQIVRNNTGVLQRVHFNFLRRVTCCIAENGNHFEHLL
jgi:Transposase.